MKKIYTLLPVLLLSISSLGSCSHDDSYYREKLGLEISNLDDDFIFGVDLSSIVEVEKAGATFHDFEGNEIDIFTLLNESGVNYIRIRLWNDPYDSNGNSFGGGSNDIDTDLEIASRAVNAGMKVCLDFHYSDFWADPSKQSIPREWESYSSDELVDVIYNYTYDTLKTFDDNGCLPSMVQLGNEITNGFLWPYGNSSDEVMCNYLKSAASAVKDISNDIKTVIHCANGGNYNQVSSFINRLEKENVDFDVIGLSYYPYWHGSVKDFNNVVTKLDQNYKYEIACMEYSYAYDINGYDLDGDIDLDAHPNISNIFDSSCEKSGGYSASVTGQASVIYDINAVVSSVSKGIGTFYWEPAWLPYEGTSWASINAHEYLLTQGDAGGEGTCSWSNQALFTLDGYPLDSLKTFNYMRSL